MDNILNVLYTKLISIVVGWVEFPVGDRFGWGVRWVEGEG